MTYFDKIALQALRFKLNAVILHVDIQVSITRADRAVALDHPTFIVVEGWGESDGVADELAVAGGVVLEK